MLIINNSFVQSSSLPDFKKSDKIAVLKFENNTFDKKLDIVGKMTADWIIHGITENTDEKVISPKVVTDYTNIVKAEASTVDNLSFLKNYFKPGKIITGYFYLEKDKLIFQCSITDGNIDETLISFKPIECDSDAPLNCIEQIKQVVLGYLSIESNSDRSYYEETPPKFEAYK